MADNRSEADKLAGVVPVAWSDGNGRGVVKRVPTLKRAASREWKAMLGDKVGVAGKLDISELGTATGALNVGSDIIADLVMAYDSGGVLGDSAFIDANVDDAQLYAALRAFLEVSFPFVSDLRSALVEVRGLIAMPAPPNSTSGRSTTGTSTPTPSTTG